MANGLSVNNWGHIIHNALDTINNLEVTEWLQEGAHALDAREPYATNAKDLSGGGHWQL